MHVVGFDKKGTARQLKNGDVIIHRGWDGLMHLFMFAPEHVFNGLTYLYFQMCEGAERVSLPAPYDHDPTFVTCIHCIQRVR